MPLVYDFTFTADDYSGQSATIVDAAGAEVAGSPVTLDVSGHCRLSLDEGVYSASVTNANLGLGNAHTTGVLNVPASIAAGGGGGTTDGVGAVFFGGSSLAVPFDSSKVYCNLDPSNDPPRAPQRDDLMTVDGEDDTTLNVVRSGLYDISLNTPLRLTIDTPPETHATQIRAAVTVEVNGDNEPPVYDYNNRAYWTVTPDQPDQLYPPVGQNWSFSQVLLAGDAVQLGFKVVQSGLETVAGTLHLDPDITFVLTYRGAVAP